MERRTVFLDKDGTLVENVPYNVDPERIRLAQGAKEGLLTLRAAGYRLVVVSNQSGVARGYFPETALRQVEAHLRSLTNDFGVSLDGFYYCPHHAKGIVPAYTRTCDCRKPQPGLLLEAAEEQGIDLHEAWMIGDILNDVEAGRKVGCRTVLIDNGNETEWNLTRERMPHHVVPTFAEAARIITAVDQENSGLPPGQKEQYRIIENIWFGRSGENVAL